MSLLRLPRPADHISTATVLRWLVGPGESFSAGAQLVELEAEEAIVVVVAQTDGVLTKLLVTPGQTVRIGEDLAELTTDPTTPDSAASRSSAESSVNEENSTADSGGVVPILMPQAGNTMEEGTVLEWRVREGDTIELGQIICEIETDKATMEYEAPAAGRLARLVAPLNEPVAVKEVIALLAESDAAADGYLAGDEPISAAVETPGATAAVPGPSAGARHSSSSPAPSVVGGRMKASPAARRLASEQGVALESVGAGSGPGGRILSSDLIPSIATTVSPAGGSTGAGVHRPLSKMRRAIGATLQHSKQTIPHYYVRATINAMPLESFYVEKKPLTSCSLNDLVVLGAGRAMRDFPAVRSKIDGDEVVEFPHANIGIAVGVDEGLVVPVVLNVDKLSLSDLARESKRVVEAARSGVLKNIGRGNFTISNLGMFGVEEFTAIINPPESGILAVGAVRETVLVEEGFMRPGRVMTMTLSVDHRVVDGVLAAKFMGRLQEILEAPAQELG